MAFRNLVFLKKVFLRSCIIGEAVMTVQLQPVVITKRLAHDICKGHLHQTVASSFATFSHTRSLSVFPNNVTCKQIKQRQTEHTFLPFINYALQTISYPEPISQTTCQHRRCLHLSSQHTSDDKKDLEDTTKAFDTKKDLEDTSKAPEEDDDPLVAKYDESGHLLSNWTRMKMMMKAYGYVIIPVHWVIAPVWFGGFYYAIKMGIDIGPVLLKIGVSEDHVVSLRNSTASTALMAYALYKVVTPLRYTVTLALTEMTIRYLRRHGYMKKAPPKEKSYRESLQETVQEMKDKAQDVKEKAQDLKEKAQDLKEKAQDFRDKRKNL